jgi:demethylmenaquinone methyltransferase/2-methoxy-6-polyprenyl-1,4-benzoquinol methylase
MGVDERVGDPRTRLAIALARCWAEVAAPHRNGGQTVIRSLRRTPGGKNLGLDACVSSNPTFFPRSGNNRGQGAAGVARPTFLPAPGALPSVPMDETALLHEQRAYYRARAREYDQWWERKGRFDRGAEANARWFEEAAELRRALDRFDPAGTVLELACGTGIWTRELTRRATRLVAVDASAEMLEINRRCADAGAVEYVQADLFEWQPPAGAFDVCFFGFWLSHVPETRFARFWETVGTALRPGGRVFFLDSDRTDRSTAVDHVLPHDGETMLRKLDDGREFRIVKRFYAPDRLRRRLFELGWDVDVHNTGEFFIYGSGSLVN